MQVMMVRSKVKSESVADVEAGVKKMFAAIDEARPAGVRYSSCKLADGVTFLARRRNPVPHWSAADV